MVVEVGEVGMERAVRREDGRSVVVRRRRRIVSRDGVAEMGARPGIAIFPRRMMKI